MPLIPHQPAADDPVVSCFDFAGEAVSFASDDRGLTRLVRQRYGAFTTDRRARWRVEYRVTGSRSPSPSFIHSARQHPSRSKRDGHRLRLETPTFSMVLDRNTGDIGLSGPLATYPVDRLIHTLFYESRRRGLILHAAALAEGDRGYVMSGPSGSGKSTLAALFPQRALCDEFVAVNLDGTAPRLASLPFWQSRRGSAIVRGIYFLRNGRANRRRRLAPAEALARLRREVAWPTFDEDALRRAFEAFSTLVTAVPVWELAFRPSVEVWEVIDREQAR